MHKLVKFAPRFALDRNAWIAIAGIVVVSIATNFVRLGKADMPRTLLNTGENLVVEFAKVPTKVFVYAWRLGTSIEAKCQQGAQKMEVPYSAVYTWNAVPLPAECSSTIVFTITQKEGSEIAELVGVDENHEPIPPIQVCRNAECSAPNQHPLFDEPRVWSSEKSYYSGTFFDEVYYARSVAELNRRLFPYENTHPPLGKTLAYWVTNVFGFHPLGWRALNALMGALIPIGIFFLSRELGLTLFAATVAGVLSYMDCSRVALSRIFTIDIQVTLWIVFASISLISFLRIYLEEGLNRRGVWRVLLTAILLGLALGTKWVAMFTLLGYGGIITVATLLRRSFLRDWWKILLLGVVPAVGMYVLAYVPYYWMLDENWSLAKTISSQKHMYSYHSNLKASHSFSSKFYTWPFIQTPLWAYSGNNYGDQHYQSLAMLGNPAVWWLIIPAVCYLLLTFEALTLGVVLSIFMFFVQYVPWMSASRISFIYHFFPGAMLILPALASLLERFSERRKAIAWGYLAIVTAMFVLFSPLFIGFPVEKAFVNSWLRWFECWYF